MDMVEFLFKGLAIIAFIFFLAFFLGANEAVRDDEEEMEEIAISSIEARDKGYNLATSFFVLFAIFLLFWLISKAIT